MKPEPVSASKLPEAGELAAELLDLRAPGGEHRRLDDDLGQCCPEAFEQLAQAGAVAQDVEAGHPVELLRELGDQEIELVLALAAEAAFGRIGEVEPHHLG
jgi:hypothetical protein